jgi:hypothetical protein
LSRQVVPLLLLAFGLSGCPALLSDNFSITSDSGVAGSTGDAGGATEQDAGQDAALTDSGPMDATVKGTGTDAGLDATLADSGPLTDGTTHTDANADGSICTNQCAEGATQCASGGDAVQTCAMQSSCTQWTTSTSCGTHQTCTGTGSASACACVSSVCTEAGTTCQDGQRSRRAWSTAIAARTWPPR